VHLTSRHRTAKAGCRRGGLPTSSPADSRPSLLMSETLAQRRLGVLAKAFTPRSFDSGHEGLTFHTKCGLTFALRLGASPTILRVEVVGSIDERLDLPFPVNENLAWTNSVRAARAVAHRNSWLKHPDLEGDESSEPWPPVILTMSTPLTEADATNVFECIEWLHTWTLCTCLNNFATGGDARCLTCAALEACSQGPECVVCHETCVNVAVCCKQPLHPWCAGKMMTPMQELYPKAKCPACRQTDVFGVV
jgi:hypothetical protein